MYLPTGGCVRRSFQKSTSRVLRVLSENPPPQASASSCPQTKAVHGTSGDPRNVRYPAAPAAPEPLHACVSFWPAAHSANRHNVHVPHYSLEAWTLWWSAPAAFPSRTRSARRTRSVSGPRRRRRRRARQEAVPLARGDPWRFPWWWLLPVFFYLRGGVLKHSEGNLQQ